MSRFDITPSHIRYRVHWSVAIVAIRFKANIHLRVKASKRERKK
jgi:hypothetical protein